MRFIPAVLLCVLLHMGSALGAELTSQQLAAKAQDALVFIATRYFDENTGQTKAAGSGSGFVITADGLVLTAYHVVKDWNAQSDEDKQNNPLRIRLGSSHGDEVDAQIVGINDQYDVALLQILRPGTYAATGVCFANTLEPGEEVTGFGFPEGLERQSSPGTFGNASADNGRWAVSFNNAEGMSGGPLYDRFGDVVGIIRGTYGGQGASNVVTPVRRARSLIEDQTRFTEECLRDTPAEPAPLPETTDWYGGSLWKSGDDYCDDVAQMIRAAQHINILHGSDGVRLSAFAEGQIEENLLFTASSANAPFCSLATDDKGQKVVDCTLDVTQSAPTFSGLFKSALNDLEQCLGKLKWMVAQTSGPNCVDADSECSYAWKRQDQNLYFYNFTSGDAADIWYGLGMTVTIPPN